MRQKAVLKSAVILLWAMWLAQTGVAADDTPRFYGTWSTTISANGQTVTMISIHDRSGYKNFLDLPTGRSPAGEGSFSAANGRWTAAALAPNDSGSYRFVDNNTVVCKNAVGQEVTWKRFAESSVAPEPARSNPASTPLPAPPAYTPDPSLPPETNEAIAAFNRKDYNTAWRKFMAAAQKGDSEAQAGVGAMLLEKINPPGTGFYAQCEGWLLKSANQGNRKGMTHLARFYFADGRRIAQGINPNVNTNPMSPDEKRMAEASFAKARMWFERAAKLGDGYAMANLAIMLDAGVGGPADPERAKQLRAGVAKNSDPQFAARATKDPAMLAINAQWQSGHFEEAFMKAQALAEKGDASAQALLGRAYYLGIGVARNYKTALIWLNRAVAQNNADAMFFLGLMYEHARGVQEDLNKALQLFDRAAALGQHYAEMEARGMRMGAETNRIAASIHANPSFGDIPCNLVGGAVIGGSCMLGGTIVDPAKVP